MNYLYVCIYINGDWYMYVYDGWFHEHVKFFGTLVKCTTCDPLTQCKGGGYPIQILK